jgi:hypothetical protein
MSKIHILPFVTLTSANTSCRTVMSWVCSCSVPGFAGPNQTDGHGWLSVVSVLCFVEVSASGWIYPKQLKLYFFWLGKVKAAEFTYFLSCLQQRACVIPWTDLKEQRDSFRIQSYPKYIYTESSQVKVCGQYGTHKTKCCVGTLILIPTMGKLFTNLYSIRISLQKSDLSWCCRDLVTLKYLPGVT